MQIFLIHLYIVLVIYITGSFLLFVHLYRLAKKYDISKSIIKWRRVVLLDCLSWPYYIVRYGVEGFFKEIK